jgi:hypothetical protein
MPEVLRECERVARKAHRCSYCGHKIRIGEKYNYAFLKYDGVYEWKSHLRCEEIAQKLWNFIDPDEGMTEEDFKEGCHEFCAAFICPSCPNHEDDDCKEDHYYCFDKIYAHLQTHDFRRVKDDRGWTHTFKCFPKEQESEAHDA